jgi:hypothetical protein
MGKRFSKIHLTFSQWKNQSGNTVYSTKIQRLHSLHPQASLSQLRGHAKKGEKGLGSLKRVSPSRIKWSMLKPKESHTRERSLEALRLMRKKGYSLTKASKVAGTTPETVRKHTGALKKIGNRYTPKKYDTVSREMRINANGREIWVSVKDSRHASKIGKYQNAVKQYLNTGDESYLKPFRKKRIRDSDGNYHTFETDPHTLHEIQERRPNEEFFMIYRTQED